MRPRRMRKHSETNEVRCEATVIPAEPIFVGILPINFHRGKSLG